MAIVSEARVEFDSSGPFIPGGVVRGTLHVTVRVGGILRGAQILCYGEEKAAWAHENVPVYEDREEEGEDGEMVTRKVEVDKVTKYYKGRSRVFEHALELLPSGTEVDSGQYEYAFAFVLPGGIPASFEVTVSNPSIDHTPAEVSISYHVDGEVGDMTGGRQFEVVQTATAAQKQHASGLQKEEVDDIYACCGCLCHRGQVEFNATLAQSVVTRGQDYVDLDVRINNQCEYPIDEVRLVVRQKVYWSGSLVDGPDDVPRARNSGWSQSDDKLLMNEHEMLTHECQVRGIKYFEIAFGCCGCPPLCTCGKSCLGIVSREGEAGTFRLRLPVRPGMQCSAVGRMVANHYSVHCVADVKNTCFDPDIPYPITVVGGTVPDELPGLQGGSPFDGESPSTGPAAGGFRRPTGGVTATAGMGDLPPQTDCDSACAEVAAGALEWEAAPAAALEPEAGTVDVETKRMLTREEATERLMRLRAAYEQGGQDAVVQEGMKELGQPLIPAGQDMGEAT